MEKLNVFSKRLGVSKRKIKDMCKDGEIYFKNVNGVYYVNKNEVKDKLNLSLKINSLNKYNFNMEKSMKEYTFLNVIDVTVMNYNKRYFKNSDMVIKTYQLFFNNYYRYVSNTNDRNFINFLNDSVNSNNQIRDDLRESNFNINFEKNIILSDVNNGLPTQIICVLNINDCLVLCNGSIIYIIDNKTKKTYFYYGD